MQTCSNKSVQLVVPSKYFGALDIDHISYVVFKNESDHNLIVNDVVLNSTISLVKKQLDALVLF